MPEQPTWVDLNVPNDREQFLIRRLQLILETSRKTWVAERDRLGTIECEAEHCLGQMQRHEQRTPVKSPQTPKKTR
jgi:hypothetical protein